ncbi:hypothetical protein GCM10010981_07640 [Dyella nitratireducens]|uniref:Uncharacterized protein n=1 Tax=Dyella nitratireducens TaxID=1849580 RepID=A0ABQ1FNZ6_9GAMM|nr:hypothetical protein GCM10010981_07640 [Dyella nitratireducens]
MSRRVAFDVIDQMLALMRTWPAVVEAFRANFSLYESEFNFENGEENKLTGKLASVASSARRQTQRLLQNVTFA